MTWTGHSLRIVVACLLGLVAFGETVAHGAGFFDDYETGTLLHTDNPPGAWTFTVTGEAQLQATSAAAHRGLYGLEISDANGGSATSANLGSLYYDDGGVTDYYARTWLRVVSSNDTGQASAVQIQGSVPSSTLAELLLVFSQRRIGIGGFDRLGNYTSSFSNNVPLDGAWHAFELHARGLGGPSGSRELWLDGQLVASNTGIDWSGQSLSNICLGECWTVEGWSGTWYVDDTRASATPLPARLLLSAAADVGVGDCVPVSVSLSDVASTIATPAPYDVIAQLAASNSAATDAGVWFTDLGCRSATTTVTLPTGSTSPSLVYFSAQASGLTTLSATQDEFLPGSALLVVGSSGTPTGIDRIGCACASGHAALPGLLSLIWFLRRRTSKR
jgi:hypothetical protein